MVLNHTSDKHQWFLDAASSRTNPKHDWYVWNDGIPADGAGVTRYQKRFEHEGTSAAQQLGIPVRRLSVGVGARGTPVLLSRVLQAAARPELAQPGG